MQIYERIKKAREASGLTPEALAAKLGVPRTTYLYWEESTPKPEKVMNVAKALGLPEYYFFIPGGDENENEIAEKGVEISDTPKENITLVNEPSEGYTKKPVTNDYLAGRLAEKDATIAQIERRITDAFAFAQKMEDHYEDMKAALERAQTTINEVLKPIKEKTEEILTNSNTTLDRLSLVETIIRSDDTVIMNNQDRQIGNEVGKSAKEAGSRQLAADKMRKGKGSQADANKPHR